MLFLLLTFLGVLRGEALRFNSKSSQNRSTPVTRRVIHFRIKIAAMAVHRDEQRTEIFDLELPQRLGIEIVEIDLLDLLDSRRLERSRTADDGEIDAADILERRLRCGEEPALADHDAHAVLLHQRSREALHACARRGADADRRVTRRIVM